MDGDGPGEWMGRALVEAILEACRLFFARDRTMLEVAVRTTFRRHRGKTDRDPWRLGTDRGG